MHKYKLSAKKGSYTVELSLLTPIIIAIFLFIFFIAYYMHDRVIIEKNCYISILRASLCVDDNEREWLAINNFEKETEEKLLGKWNMEKIYTEDRDEACLVVQGYMEMNEGLLKKVIGEKIFFYKTECRANKVNETEYLRKNRRVE